MPKAKSLQPICVETVKRTAISEHPKNPREISDVSEKKLRSGLDRYGLLEPIVVNRQSGHILSGHQRIKWLDKKNGSIDYSLQIAYCDIDRKEEINVMALLNNEAAQGEWNLARLEDLIDAGELVPQLAAFDEVQLEKLLPDADISALFGDDGTGLEKSVAAMDVVKQKSARKAENAALSSACDTEIYLIVVFGSRAEKEQILSSLKLPKDERYVPFSRLTAVAGLADRGSDKISARSGLRRPETKRAGHKKRLRK